MAIDIVDEIQPLDIVLGIRSELNGASRAEFSSAFAAGKPEALLLPGPVNPIEIYPPATALEKTSR